MVSSNTDSLIFRESMMKSTKSYWMLALFLVLVGAVAMTGVQFRPGGWYLMLEKPFWTPPSWVFPPVWTVLYVMIAVAGWLTYAGHDWRLKALWLLQLGLNALWSWLFFGLHRVDLGLIDIIALLFTIAAFVALAFRQDKRPAWWMLPYLLWVAYATTLNAAIYLMNG